ncbi:MAG: hypothetical protein A2Z27_02030 [candidate division Zixibacteria bacterium RBG_16_50_21]|nr:MAG: hypothetical protein A2Z27_02030 [candidate division Zixibacteria bacterium RBG_16_50_21]
MPAALEGQLVPKKFEDIIGEAFSIYRKHFLKLITIIALPLLLYYLIESILNVGHWYNCGAEETDLLSSLLKSFLAMTSSMLLFPIEIGGMIRAVAGHYLEAQVDIVDAYDFAFKKYFPLLGTELLAFLAVLFLSVTIICIPLAIYFIVAWLFNSPAVALQGTSPAQALKTSSNLVKGNWWRAVGILFLSFLILLVIGLLFLPLLFLAPYLVLPVVSIILGPVGFIVVLLLYFDLRVRKEGYTLEQMRKEIYPKSAPISAVE